MGKPGYDYQEPDCCGNCEFSEGYQFACFCTNKKQEENKSINNPDSVILVNSFGRCSLYKKYNPD